MFNYYLPILITLLLTLSCFSGDVLNLKNTKRDCTTGVNGYCADCDHSVLCNGNVTVSNTTCPVGQACQEVSSFASCVDSLDVQACECPATGQAIYPDLYDDQKFIVCDEGVRHIEQCHENEIFNVDTKHCEAIPTTSTSTSITTSKSTPVTRSPSCPDNEFDSVPISCTQFQVCYSDGTASNIKSCPPGYIFNDEKNTCDQYAPFSCYNRTDGFYADTHNCSVYYLCIDGEIFGSPSVCPDGDLFDNSAETCLPAANSTCAEVVDCGICPDADTFIYIDCFNYYDCQNSTNGDLPFVPVLNSCPPGTCFNASTTFCEFITQFIGNVL